MNVRLRVVVLCWAVLSSAQAEVTVKEGAYHDLVVSFSPNVNATNGKTIVESLERLFTDTSAVLQKAIGLRISGVTFHLPSTWDTSTWENKTVEHASVLNQDQRYLVVDDTADSAFGTLPSTLQYGGCGVPGHKLTVPVAFLEEDTVEDVPKGKLLAREWLKFRYGVFDENGFDGDDMYPLYYTIPGTTEARITECTSPEVEYYFRDADGNNCSLEIPFASSEKCEIHPKEVSENTTSSLMYYHKELTNMQSVCGKEHNHTNSTPSKQNVLCSGLSIWDVLAMSGDFNETNSEDVQHENDEIKFLYRQETKPRVVLAFEHSDYLHDERHMVLFAIRRFIHFLPDGSEFGLYSFTDQVTENRALSQIGAERDFAIPSDFVWNLDICSSCALDKAVEALSDKPQVQSTIILITGSNSSAINDALIDKYNKAPNVCLKIMAFRSDGDPVVGYEELISSRSCHAISIIEKESSDLPEELIFEQLYKGLQESVTQSPTDTKVSGVTAGIMSPTISLKIDIHSTAAKYTLWTNKTVGENVISCSKADGSSIKLTASVTTSSIASYTFDPVEELKEVNCKMNFPKAPVLFTQVEMTSKPGEYIDGEVFVHDPSNSKEQMPVILYAKLNYGTNPVQDARVTAMVFINGTLHKLELLDNGRGNPDITQGDGIYSRYFVDFSSEGEYKVIVVASDNYGESQVGRKGQDPCCGSKVKSTSENLGFFTVKPFETFFYAKQRPENGYKPSRVFDLRVANYDPLNFIVLNWTAPGGEADKGNASSYEFFVICQSEDCKENGQLPEWISFNNSIPTPSMSGEEEVAVLILNSGAPKNETISFYLQATSPNGLISEISNLVTVQLGEFSQPPTIIDPIEINDNGLSQATIRAIIGGSVLGLFVLICIAFVAYKSAKKIRGPRARDFPKSECINHGFADSTKDLKNSNTRDSLSKENDTRNDSSKMNYARDGSSNKGDDTRDGSSKKRETLPVVLYTHDQIRHIKEKTNTPPLYGENVGPKPWLSLDSLSRKLNKEDDNKSEDSASTLPANGTDYTSKEVKQISDNAHTSELPVEKVAKF